MISFYNNIKFDKNRHGGLIRWQKNTIWSQNLDSPFNILDLAGINAGFCIKRQQVKIFWDRNFYSN